MINHCSCLLKRQVNDKLVFLFTEEAVGITGHELNDSALVTFIKHIMHNLEFRISKQQPYVIINNIAILI